MPAKWQQWMPFHIDKFRGSPSVQAMHPSARIGYLYLLASAWQSDDCTISSDALDLADQSGLGDELWGLHGPRILRKFERVGDTDRLRNEVEYLEWIEAKRIYDARQASANKTNSKRSPNGDPSTSVDQGNDDRDGDRTVTARGPSRPADTITLTSTETLKRTETKGDTRGRAIPNPPSPGSKGEFAAAFWLQQEIGMPATAGDIQLIAQTIQFCARDAQVDTEQAAEQLKRWAQEATARGEIVNIFWFKDRKFMEQPNGGPNAAAGNRSQQRTNGNIAALEAARQARRNRENAGGAGGSETGIDQRGDLRGLLVTPGGLPN